MSQAKFEKAVSIVQGLPKDGPIKPTQDEQLYFYSYYKQATVGDVNIPRPGLMEFTGKAKWCVLRLTLIPTTRILNHSLLCDVFGLDDASSRIMRADCDLHFVGFRDAWKKVEGTSKEDAYAKYVEKLLEVLRKADTEEAKTFIAEIEAA
ncbi:hypothetical protein EW146_g2520 [Bondarzewia mesenterica]|uniref:ACB domain-containing protein n=1 Tax=Bondarzewia mesenterica TaxID=1095465 RepID=A0A4S4M0I5_9AGAM|nr:hypothetical protein EW146_g2520 [Bondarzewia mesenterica]